MFMYLVQTMQNPHLSPLTFTWPHLTCHSCRDCNKPAWVKILCCLLKCVFQICIFCILSVSDGHWYDLIYKFFYYVLCYSVGRCLQYWKDITMWHRKLGLNSHASDRLKTHKSDMVGSVRISAWPARMLSRLLKPVNSKLASIWERVFCLSF